jgi:hypothetical protein
MVLIAIETIIDDKNLKNKATLTLTTSLRTQQCKGANIPSLTSHHNPEVNGI